MTRWILLFLAAGWAAAPCPGFAQQGRRIPTLIFDDDPIIIKAPRLRISDQYRIDPRINAVLRGRRWTVGESDTIRAGDIVVSPTSFRAWRAGQPIALANLELKLLTELARHAGEVVTRAMLSERVWGYEFEPETNVVDVYIRRLRVKLTEAGGSDPIETVRGIGYSLKP